MRRVLLLAALLLGGCSDETSEVRVEQVDLMDVPKAGVPDAGSEDAVMAKWARSCALCHVNGEGGAPRVGHPDEWAGRLAQGDLVLLDHAIEGYNNMPPLGYCMDCEAADLAALIAFMAGES